MITIHKSDFIGKIKPLKAAIASKLTSNAEGVLIRDDQIIADNFDYTIATQFICRAAPFVLPKRAIELIELQITEDLIKQRENEATRLLCIHSLDREEDDWDNYVSDDDMLSASKMLKYCEKHLSVASHQRLLNEIEDSKKKTAACTAWRIEGTLREFPKFPPLNVWFRFPVHVPDETGALQDLQSDTSTTTWKKNFPKKKTNAQRKEDRRQSLMTAFSAAVEDGTAQVHDVAEYLGVNEDTVRNYVKENKDSFWCKNGLIGQV